MDSRLSRVGFQRAGLFLFLSISLFLYACGSEEGGGAKNTDTTNDNTSGTSSTSSQAKLEGPSGDLANTHLPKIDFPDPPPEDIEWMEILICSGCDFMVELEGYDEAHKNYGMS